MTNGSHDRPRAVRLTFAYKGDKVELVSQQRVEMRVPPTGPVRRGARQGGFWYELKDATNRTLYRHVMPNPIVRDVEVFTNEPKQPVRRQPVSEPEGVFTVLVPELRGGHAVTLSTIAPAAPWTRARTRGRARGPATRAKARELARVVLEPS